MNIIGISEKYQGALAQAVLKAGVEKKISVPDEAKADYDAERAGENLKPRELWIALSQHHEAEKESDAQSEGPDGDEVTPEKEGKTPLGEFILSYFDYTTGQFPKGETAILTMVEKDYGEQFINPAKQFIEKINNRVAEVMGYREEPVVQDNTELDSIRSLAGL